jgi:hypothetical protein
VAIAKLCAQLDVPHIINNAYGVQSAQLCAAITSALRKGRVDAIVQSTDKNFMVPVAGAVVAAPSSRPQLAQVGDCFTCICTALYPETTVDIALLVPCCPRLRQGCLCSGHWHTYTAVYAGHHATRDTHSACSALVLVVVVVKSSHLWCSCY